MKTAHDTTNLPVGTIIETEHCTLRILGRTTYAALEAAVGFRAPFPTLRDEPFYVGQRLSGPSVNSNGLIAACRQLFGDVDCAVWCGVKYKHSITVVRLPVPDDNEVDA